MYFIQTLIMWCTVSDIWAAAIDHQCANWTFLTLKITFRMNPYLSYFRTGLVSPQISYMMQYIWAALHYYWIISIIMWKWAKPDFLTLKMTFWIIQWNPSLDSWSISSPRSCIQEILRKLSKISKTISPIWPFPDLSKWPLDRFYRFHFFTVH